MEVNKHLRSIGVVEGHRCIAAVTGHEWKGELSFDTRAPVTRML